MLSVKKKFIKDVGFSLLEVAGKIQEHKGQVKVGRKKKRSGQMEQINLF